MFDEYGNWWDNNGDVIEDPNTVTPIFDWENNGDGTYTDKNTGDIYDTAGAYVGQDNGNGTWTDYNGNVYNNDNSPVNDWTDNGDGSYTQNSTGEIYDSAGDYVGQDNGNGTWTDYNGNVYNNDNSPATTEPASDWVNNDDGTYTNTKNGDTYYNNGDTEHSNGTWTFADGTQYNPNAGSNTAPGRQTTDALLQKAGAPTIGGSFGGSTSGGGSSNQQNSVVQQAITALTNLAKQALANNNQPQLAAVRAAQARLGAPVTSNSGSSWLLPVGIAAALFIALRQQS